MVCLKTIPLYILLFVSVASCNNNPSTAISTNYRDSFYYFITKGDEAYAKKNSLKSFEESLKYYDSARVIADASNDTILLAEAVFAKGRVYDGWNKEPKNTILHFTEAARLFSLKPNMFKRYLYAKHLVAHAYDKIHDSANTVKILNEVYEEVAHLDTTIKKSLPFVTEMALISTEVKNYELAEKILANLTKRTWIKNDPETYDYLNHYYLTKSRLEIYNKKNFKSPYLDSLKIVLSNQNNIIDRMYYSDNLATLYSVAGDLGKAFYMLKLSKSYSDSVNNNVDINNMESALLRSKLSAEKKRIEYEESLKKTRTDIISILSVLLTIITVLSIHLQRQKKKYIDKTNELAETNQILDKNMHQVEVLNKEIQHRVKNNLQMISSLLQMQQRKSASDETADNLQAAVLRIESIASLNNELINNNSNPDLRNHIKNVVSGAVKCLSNDRSVVSHISVENVSVRLKQYLPISLIINEWVTNSIKYANTPDGLLEINIAIKKSGDKIQLLYNDNGVHQTKQPGGLGTQIITMLCRQISGKLNTCTNNPYNYELIIENEQ